jgi:hypothetical protein
MATIDGKAYDGVTTQMSTELNSLAAAATAVQTTAFDNTTGQAIWGDLELSVTFAVAPVVSTTVDLYYIPSIDGGTTYADGSASVAIAKANYQGGFELRAVATLQVLVLRNIQLLPGKGKFALINTTAQAFTASGQTLRLNTHSMTVA